MQDLAGLLGGARCGSRGDEQEKIRASLQAVNPHIRIAAMATSNHGAILKKDLAAIAAAVQGESRIKKIKINIM